MAAVTEDIVEGEAAGGHAVGDAMDEAFLAGLDGVFIELAADAGRVEDFLARQEDLVHVAGFGQDDGVFGRGATDIDGERRAEFDVGHFGDESRVHGIVQVLGHFFQLGQGDGTHKVFGTLDVEQEAHGEVVKLHR